MITACKVSGPKCVASKRTKQFYCLAQPRNYLLDLDKRTGREEKQGKAPHGGGWGGGAAVGRMFQDGVGDLEPRRRIRSCWRIGSGGFLFIAQRQRARGEGGGMDRYLAIIVRRIQHPYCNYGIFGLKAEEILFLFDVTT